MNWAPPASIMSVNQVVRRGRIEALRGWGLWEQLGLYSVRFSG